MFSKTKTTIVLFFLIQLAFAVDIFCRTCTPDGVAYSLQSTRAFGVFVRGNCHDAHTVSTSDGEALFEDLGGSTFRASGPSGWWRECQNWSELRPCCTIVI